MDATEPCDKHQALSDTGRRDLSPTSQAKLRRTSILRKIVLVFLIAATLALAWWQWTRFQSSSGTFQNLGYALQWPAFGAFFFYAFRQFDKYEKEITETGINPEERKRQEKIARGQFTEIDENFLPSRPQLDVDAFNALNAPTRKKPGTTHSVSD